MNDRGNSRDRSRQSGFGGAASGQKTATGHTETTRANAVKPLAVRRPPKIAQRPHKGKQQTRWSTPTASRPLNRAQQAEQQDRTREPFDQERAQSTLPASQAEDRKAREDPNWSSTRQTHPPHHLAERAVMKRERHNREQGKKTLKILPPQHLAEHPEMRRENQPGQKREQESAAREQLLDPQSTNEPRRQKQARVHRTLDQRLLHPSRWTKSSERRGKPSGSNTRASRDHPPPSRPSEGREREEGRPGVHDFRRSHSRRKDIGAVEEEPEGRKRKVCASK